MKKELKVILIILILFLSLLLINNFKQDKINSNSIFNTIKDLFSESIGKKMDNTYNFIGNNEEQNNLIIQPQWAIQSCDFIGYPSVDFYVFDAVEMISDYPNINLRRIDFDRLEEDKTTREVWLTVPPDEICNTLVFYKDKERYNKKTFAGYIILKAYLDGCSIPDKPSDGLNLLKENNYENSGIILEPLKSVDLSSDSGYPGLNVADVVHIKSTNEMNTINLREIDFFNLTKDINTDEVWIAQIPGRDCKALAFYRSTEVTL